MVRRSFRIGLRLGLLVGAALAVGMTVRSRRSGPSKAAPAPAPWVPLRDTAPIVDEPLVDEVGEPVMEPAAAEPVPEPESPSDAGAPEGTPPEAELLGASVEEATEQTDALDVPLTDGPEEPVAPKPIRPRRGPARKKASPVVPAAPWVEAEGGVCPPTHPVKAKLASRLFHLPGMFAYDRTRPDRCYADADSAVQDGFTSAKR